MICVDANILLEIILERRYAEACNAYLETARDKLAISTLSLCTTMYYAELKRLDLNLATVEGFLERFRWLPLLDTDTHWAFAHYARNDFEDALQIAIALREGCSRFATLDKQLAKKYARTMPVDLLA